MPPIITRAAFLEKAKSGLPSIVSESGDPKQTEVKRAVNWLLNVTAAYLAGDPSKSEEKDTLDEAQAQSMREELTQYNKYFSDYYMRCLNGHVTGEGDVTKVTPDALLLKAFQDRAKNGFQVSNVHPEKKTSQIREALKKRNATPMEYIALHSTDNTEKYTLRDVYPYERKVPEEDQKLFWAMRLWEKGQGASRDVRLENLTSYKADLRADPMDVLMLRSPRTAEICRKGNLSDLKAARDSLTRSFSFSTVEEAKEAQTAALRTLASMENQTCKAAGTESWKQLKDSLWEFAQTPVTDKASLSALANKSAQILVNAEQFTKGRKNIQKPETQLCVDLALDTLAITIPNAQTNPCVTPLVNRFNQVRGRNKPQVDLQKCGLVSPHYVQEFTKPERFLGILSEMSDYIGPSSGENDKKWNDFCDALQESSKLGLKKAVSYIEDDPQNTENPDRQKKSPNWTQETNKTVNGILDTVELYLKGKKAEQDTYEEQLQVDLTLDVLAELSRYSDEAAQRVNKIVNRINEVRDGNGEDRVDLQNYGVEKMGDRKRYLTQLRNERLIRDNKLSEREVILPKEIKETDLDLFMSDR